MSVSKRYFYSWVLLWCVPLVCAAAAAYAQREYKPAPADELQPDSAKECAICHYLWVDTFFVEHRGSELVSLPTKPVAAEADMCFSCHDGSTVDSRGHVFNDRRHQVGVTPSDKIKIPEIFPLDEDGKMDCATCHSAHGVSTEPGIERTIFLRTSHENSQMCTMCHVGQTGGPETGHHPVDKTTLRIPDSIGRYGGYIGSKPNQVICESCHMAHGGFSDKRLVLPVDRPAEYPVLCEACHGKAPGLSEHTSRNRFSHSVDIMPEKAAVPKAWKNGRDVRLGARGELVCVTCHVTHEAPVSESLLAAPNSKDVLCLQCHADQDELIKGTKHDPALMDPDAQNIQGHTAASSGPCSCCHLTHEGVGPFMWARAWEGAEEPPVGICKSCHAAGRCAEESPIPETGHPIGVKPEDTSAVMDFPLFTETGKKNAQGLIYCSSCHNSHQWDPADPDNKGSRDEKGTISNSFLRTAQQGSNLCLGCHKQQAAVEKTDHDLSVSAPAARNMRDQSPAESGVCGCCHIAHGGAAILMWSRTLPGGADDRPSVMSALCLECHRTGSCAEKKLPGDYSHAVDVGLQPGTGTHLPLYTPEGTKDLQGMLVCSTCHNSHQWHPADPCTKGDEGTPADSFLRLASDRESPLCAACHQQQALVEGTDHDMRLAAPDEPNSQQLMPESSGLCGACHAAHNARGQAFLWNRDGGPAVVGTWNEEFTGSQNLMTGLCTSCHREGACAAEQVPAYGLHPDRVYMAALQEKAEVLTEDEYAHYLSRFPVYADDGEQSVEGNIVCSTCHDAHLWNAHHAGKGPGTAVEGNATTSFLRKDISFSFCASCHGEDAIFMFKYFHMLKGRQKPEPPEAGEETAGGADSEQPATSNQQPAAIDE